MCDEHGIGGNGKYCGDNKAQLNRINVFYYEASGGKYAPRAVFFDLEPGVIGPVCASPLVDLFRPGNLVNHTRGQKWAKNTTEGFTPAFLTPNTRELSTNPTPPPAL